VTFGTKISYQYTHRLDVTHAFRYAVTCETLIEPPTYSTQPV